jgi:hypothetical protein
MWLLKRYGPARLRVETSSNLVLCQCHIDDRLAITLDRGNCPWWHKYQSAVQPITNIRYDVRNPPIPIIEVEFLNVTNISVNRVDSGALKDFRIS